MNGDPTLSPSKTLKLTLKVTKSPGKPADRRKADDTEHGDDAESQSVFVKSPPTAMAAAIPTPSHHRKPSIFGTATVEEDEQQDEADPEDGELSDVGDEQAEKDDADNDMGEGDGPLINEDKVEDSEGEDVDVTGKLRSCTDYDWRLIGAMFPCRLQPHDRQRQRGSSAHYPENRPARLQTLQLLRLLCIPSERPPLSPRRLLSPHWKPWRRC